MAPTVPETYPWTTVVKGDSWDSGVVIDVRAIRGRTATVSVEIGGDIFFRFQRPHWDGLRDAFRAIDTIQDMQAKGMSFSEIKENTAARSVELTMPDYDLPAWMKWLMIWKDKWASLRVPCLNGAMYVGLSSTDETIGLSTSGYRKALCRPMFSGEKRAHLIDHIVFAAEHAKTILEKR